MTRLDLVGVDQPVLNEQPLQAEYHLS